MIDSPGELLEMINSPGYSTPDQWQAQIQMKASVSVVAGCLDPEQIRAAHFEPAEDAGEAALQALASSGPGSTLCVLPQGPQTIPYIVRSMRWNACERRSSGVVYSLINFEQLCGH